MRLDGRLHVSHDSYYVVNIACTSCSTASSGLKISNTALIYFKWQQLRHADEPYKHVYVGTNRRLTPLSQSVVLCAW